MTAEKQAREGITHQRQHDQHRQDTMASRASAEVNQKDGSSVDEQAREGLTHDRQHGQHLQETMSDRAESEE